MTSGQLLSCGPLIGMTVIAMALPISGQSQSSVDLGRLFRVVDPTHLKGWPSFTGSRKISAAMPSAQTVVVADLEGSRVQLLRSDGTSRQVVSRGTGAGQVNAPRAVISLLAGRVGVWDWGNMNLLEFDDRGTIRGSRRIRVNLINTGKSYEQTSLVGRFRDGRFLARISPARQGGTGPMVKPESSRVALIRPDGREDRVLQELKGEEFFHYGDHLVMDDAPLRRRWSIAVGAESWFVVNGQSFEITEYSPDGSVIRTFGRGEPPRALTTAEVSRWVTAKVMDMPSSHTASMAGALSQFDYQGAVSGYTEIITDSDGNIWAGELGIPGAVRRWDVYAPGGKALGHVIMPARTRPLWIGADLLVAAVDDTDGWKAEVRVLRLNNPPS